MKIHYVKKSRKDYTCGKCKKELPAGSPYRWYKPRYAQRRIRCMVCEIKRSEYVPGRLGEVYGIQEDLEVNLNNSETPDEASDYLETAMAEIQEKIDEYREAAQNVEDVFGSDSPSVTLSTEAADSLEEWYNSLEMLQGDIETWKDEWEEQEEKWKENPELLIEDGYPYNGDGDLENMIDSALNDWWNDAKDFSPVDELNL